MSQSINFANVTDATFNGTVVEQINLNGTSVWTMPAGGVDPMQLSLQINLCGSALAINGGPTGPYDNGPEFGRSVSVSPDGNYYAVGVRNTEPYQGSAHVFNSSGSLLYTSNEYSTIGGSIGLTNDYFFLLDRFDTNGQILHVKNISDGSHVRTIQTGVTYSSSLGSFATIRVKADTNIVYIRFNNVIEAWDISTGSRLYSYTSVGGNSGTSLSAFDLTDNYVFLISPNSGFVKLDLSLNEIATYPTTGYTESISATENSVGISGAYGGLFAIYSHSGSLITSNTDVEAVWSEVASSGTYFYNSRGTSVGGGGIFIYSDEGTLVRTMSEGVIAGANKFMSINQDSLIIGTPGGTTSACSDSYGSGTGMAQIWKV